MDELEIKQREQVVEIARTLLHTQWRHMGRTRAGLDCGGLPILVFKEAKLIAQDFETEYYPPDFMLHRDEERFVGFVERFARRVEREPRNGDIPMFRVGRVLAHCGIVDQWPRIIHAVRQGGEVQYDSADKGELRARFEGFWTLKEWT